MPFNSDGTFSLTQEFGTGTPPNNDFPPQVGEVLDDIATALGQVSVSAVNAAGRLTFVSSTSIKFVPYNGDSIRIAGLNYSIPSSGISAANTNVYVNGVAAQNLASGTNYWVYLFVNSGTLTVDFSTTTHATDTTAGNVGIEIKTGDSSRSLIGLVTTNASSQFQDDVTWVGVLSWFNRRNKYALLATSNVSTASVAFTIVAGPAVMANWGEDAPFMQHYGQSNTNGSFGGVQVGTDGTTRFGVQQFTYTGAAFTGFPMITGGTQTIAEGGHAYYLILGSQGGGGTVSSFNGTLNGFTRG